MPRIPVFLTGLCIVIAGCAGSPPGPSSSAANFGPSAAVEASAEPTATTAAKPTPAPSAASLADGEPWLLFSKFTSENTKSAFLVRPDGSDVRLILTDVAGDIRAPSWSPDGRRIAFVVRDAATPNGSIWTADADGSHAKVVFDGVKDCPGGAFYPVWSPDGRQMALVCYGSGDVSSIAILDLATIRLSKVTSVKWPEFLDNQPHWSRDGRSIAFDILHWDPTNVFLDGSLIATVPIATGKVHRLTQFASFATCPEWTASDDELIYDTYDLGNIGSTPHASNLYTVKPDGRGSKQLTTASTDGTKRIGHPRLDVVTDRIWVTVLGSNGVNLAWVDPRSGALNELSVEGARPEPRPVR